MIQQSYKNLQAGLAFLLGGLSVLLAQTTNSGTLTVMPGTQFSSVGDFNNTAVFYNDGEYFFYGHFNNSTAILIMMGR